ncbi:MAG: glutaminyl-peptide cyclotransferase [Planctomycetota bacterium]
MERRKLRTKHHSPVEPVRRRSRFTLFVSAVCILAGLLTIGFAAAQSRDSGDAGYHWISQRTTRSAPVYRVEVVNTFPHDSDAYSQGLDFDGETLFESTGQYGKSSVRRVNLKTGRVEKLLRLDDRLFGEGLTLFDDKLVQITWKRGVGYIYDAETLKFERQFRYSGEGWGLTYDGDHLILSDGSDRLKFLDTNSFKVVRTIRVKDGTRPIRQLNELEYVNGQVLANVWHKDQIAIIAPATGKVTGWLDLTGLLGETLGPESVLNGIAYEDGRLFVTGKNWPKLFEIKLKRR